MATTNVFTLERVAAERAEERIVVRVPYSRGPQIQTIAGAKNDPTVDLWYLPLSWASCVALRGVFGDSIDVGPALTQWSWEEFQRRVKPALDLCTAFVLPEDYTSPILQSLCVSLYDTPARTQPRVHQSSGAMFLKVADSSLLIDDIGAGKTLTAMMAMELTADSFPALVVCPSAVKVDAWQRSYEQRMPWRSVSVIGGTVGQRRKALAPGFDVYVINWELLIKHSRLAAFGSMALSDTEKAPKELNSFTFGTVVADEAHRAKDPGAKMTRALWAIGDHARHRIALTGTPIANSPEDLWSIMRFVSPSEFPAKTRYIERYTVVGYNAFGGREVSSFQPDHIEELFKFLQPRMRRMPKELVLADLPPKVYQWRATELPQKLRKAYEQMDQTMVSEGIVVTSPLVRGMRLMQFASGTCELHTDDAGKQQVRLGLPSPKIEALLDILDETDEPIVAVAASRQLIDAAAGELARKNISFGLITGYIGADERQRYIDAFQAGQLRVMLMTIGAGGTGITLTRSRIMVFLQRSWSNIENRQCEGRIHRIGSEQHSSVLYIHLYAPHTVEERQVDALQEKQRLLDTILRDDQLLAQYGLAGLSEAERSQRIDDLLETELAKTFVGIAGTGGEIDDVV